MHVFNTVPQLKPVQIRHFIPPKADGHILKQEHYEKTYTNLLTYLLT
jgi:hypothetical protein